MNTPEIKDKYYSQKRYIKHRYNNDEEYRLKQIESGKKRYQLHKEEIHKRYETDEDFRNHRAIIAKIYYRKIADERKAKKEEELKNKTPEELEQIKEQKRIEKALKKQLKKEAQVAENS